MVLAFDEMGPAEQAAAGGKGGTLARLYQAGYPVPNGFVIFPTAFAGEILADEAWPAVQTQAARLRAGAEGVTLAVRSSGRHEDSAAASFAGELETVLDVAQAGLRDAIERVYRSRHSARVRAYREAQGAAEPAMDAAVVVQRLVRAELAGVLFTADPVSGSRMSMTGNYVHGLGERLVAGEATPETFTLAWPRGKYQGPGGLRRYARRLFKLGRRLEQELGAPQDIEWAVAGGRLYLLQSRPISTMQGHNPATGEWNHSLTGDYLWSKTNFGEAVVDVMTPATWSMMSTYIEEATPLRLPGNVPLAGNIGGRFYMNVSYVASLARVMRRDPRQLMEQAGENTFGHIPQGIEIPTFPLTLWQLVSEILLPGFKARWQIRKDLAQLPTFLVENPAWCERMRQRITAAGTPVALGRLWREELLPAFRRAARMLRSTISQLDDPAAALRRDLIEMVGAAEANTLLSAADDEAASLASLGPVRGIARLAASAMSRQEYLAQYGHRGPHEVELSMPRPVEDSAWLDKQLAELAGTAADVEAMLAERRAEHQAAWQRFVQRYPRRAKKMRQRLDDIAEAFRQREAARSEGTRVIGLIRTFYLRVGELTGLGDGIFFLTFAEMLALLEGDDAATAYIPARRETHAHYSDLPPYPAIISGRFDPFHWAADPQRRHDLYDAHAPAAVDDSDTIRGFAGAAGEVEGMVRVIDDLAAADQLRPGEILVTATTNIGWTPVFPRAAAVVTDVGAPLSHAAIVARELGVPAVVGTGDATMRLRSGDRVRVNGGQGTVIVLGKDGEK